MRAASRRRHHIRTRRRAALEGRIATSRSGQNAPRHVETHRAVCVWMQQRLVEVGLLRGNTGESRGDRRRRQIVPAALIRTVVGDVALERPSMHPRFWEDAVAVPDSRRLLHHDGGSRQTAAGRIRKWLATTEWDLRSPHVASIHVRSVSSVRVFRLRTPVALTSPRRRYQSVVPTVCRQTTS